MNKKQKNLLIVVAMVMVTMLFFPPLQVPSSGAHVGYGFIFKPSHYPRAVNVGLLLVQQLVVGAVGFIGWYLLESKD